MENPLTLVKLDTEYCNYLRQFDTKVPYNYGKKELRPFVGVLFKVNDCMYFAPLSSPKPKHLKMPSKLDFLKLDNGKLGAVNFNNMIPVTKNNVIKIDLEQKFTSKKENNYINLLKEQLYWLNRNDEKIYGRARTLYEKYVNGSLNSHIVRRCCNFKLLEEKCLEYNEVVSAI